MEQHIRDDLSAYLDGELLPGERAQVEAHLAACAVCRSARDEIGATARLIAGLPAPAATRGLVPSLAPRYAWLRPARSLSTVLAGTFLFVFMASATLDTGFRMGGGGPQRATGAATREAAPAGATLRQEQKGATPAPAAAVASPAQVQDSSQAATPAKVTPQPLRVGPSPWLWLTLALLSGMLAFAAHRRLRTT